jgi:preprotein translocase SecE subunit
VARDRQRAKQRKARRAASGGAPGGARENLHREEVPGSLDHASGEVDEFEAALVSGADGTEAEQDEADQDEQEPAGDVAGPHPEELSDEDFEDVEDEVDEAATTGRVPERRAGAAAEPAKAGVGSRFLAFLRASWAELQRVQWPDRRQVGQATAVVLGFVVVAGAYLGLADVVAQEIVDFII